MKTNLKKVKSIILKLSLSLVLFMTFDGAKAQGLSVSYYQSDVSKIGIAYDFTDRIRSEVRGFSYPTYSDFTVELFVSYDLISKERHSLYLGVGGAVGVYDAVILPLGVEFQPIKEFERFTLQIELMSILEDGDYGFQNSVGLKYRFKS